LTAVGPQAGFIARFGPAGEHRFSRRFGGEGAERGDAIALTPGGDVVIGGQLHGLLDLGAPPLTNEGLEDIFIARLSPAGDQRWSRKIGERHYRERLLALACPSDDTIYVTGVFKDTIEFDDTRLTSPPRADADDDTRPKGSPFLAALTGAGVTRWAQIPDARFSELVPGGLAVSASGELVIAGNSRRPAPLDANGKRAAEGVGDEFFIQVLKPDGSPRAAPHYVGTQSWGRARAVAIRGDGSIVVAGNEINEFSNKRHKRTFSSSSIILRGLAWPTHK
jgi:hypothetical protein